MAVWSVGWRSALRRADAVSNAVRISTDKYGCVRRRVTWCSECHVLLYFYSTWLRVLLVGGAYCAEHRVGANPTMNTMNTGNTIDGQWHTVSHVLRKFHGTWLTRFPVLSPVFLVFPVFPVGLAHSIGSAQCALPANRTRSQVLRKFHSAWHTLRHVPRQYSWYS